MNWAALSKEDKQRMALFVLLGVGVIYGVYQYVIVPVLNNRAEAVRKFDDLKIRYDEAKRMIQDEVHFDSKYKDARTELESAYDGHLPPANNASSWASRFVYAQARLTGVDVTQVVPVDAAAAGWGQPDLAGRAFKAYGVRVDFNTGLLQVTDFIRTLQTNNPYLSVSKISIDADPGSPERHKVSLVLEWPWPSQPLPPPGSAAKTNFNAKVDAHAL